MVNKIYIQQIHCSWLSDLSGFDATIFFYHPFYLKTRDYTQEGDIGNRREHYISLQQLTSLCYLKLLFDLREMNATGE